MVIEIRNNEAFDASPALTLAQLQERLGEQEAIRDRAIASIADINTAISAVS
jgi:hypothetical protein